MLRRTPFRRKPVHEPAVEREPRPLARLERVPNYGGGTTGPIPKAHEPVRDEGYRRWVASLPCFECGIHGYSQAAHPNSGKARGKKLSDDRCFPMCCDRPGVLGCHGRFDRYEIVSRNDMPEYESRALEWTRQQAEIGATA